jgi:hypothetical protein
MLDEPSLLLVPARTAAVIRDRQLPTEAGLWECYLAGPETDPDSSRWRTELTRPLAAPDSG